MKDYNLLKTWQPTDEQGFEDLFHEFNEDLDTGTYWFGNTLEELVGELEYQGFEFDDLVQYTKNRYGTVLEIIEYKSSFYAFIGSN